MFSLYDDDNKKMVISQELTLKNEKFSWADKKKGTRKLANLFKGVNDNYAARAQFCASHLEFNLLEAQPMGDNILDAINGKKQLSMANFCQLRTCPLCNARRSAKLAVMLSRCMDAINEDHPGTRYLFLTLAVRNCKADELVKTIDHIMKAYNKLMRRRPVQRAIKGSFRTMEITYNERTDTYHPHLHILLAVEESYFAYSNGLYISQEKWVKMWSESLKVDYLATAHIKRADKSPKAIAEVAKYAVKDTDYLKLADKNINKARDVVVTFSNALYKRRLVQAGGWFRDHWNEKQEEDLLRIKDTGEAHSRWYSLYAYAYKRLEDYFLTQVYTKDEDGNKDDFMYFDDETEE